MAVKVFQNVLWILGLVQQTGVASGMGSPPCHPELTTHENCKVSASTYPLRGSVSQSKSDARSFYYPSRLKIPLSEKPHQSSRGIRSLLRNRESTKEDNIFSRKIRHISNPPTSSEVLSFFDDWRPMSRFSPYLKFNVPKVAHDPTTYFSSESQQTPRKGRELYTKVGVMPSAMDGGILARDISYSNTNNTTEDNEALWPLDHDGANRLGNQEKVPPHTGKNGDRVATLTKDDITRSKKAFKTGARIEESDILQMKQREYPRSKSFAIDEKEFLLGANQVSTSPPLKGDHDILASSKQSTEIEKNTKEQDDEYLEFDSSSDPEYPSTWDEYSEDKVEIEDIPHPMVSPFKNTDFVNIADFFLRKQDEQKEIVEADDFEGEVTKDDDSERSWTVRAADIIRPNNSYTPFGHQFATQHRLGIIRHDMETDDFTRLHLVTKKDPERLIYIPESRVDKFIDRYLFEAVPDNSFNLSSGSEIKRHLSEEAKRHEPSKTKNMNIFEPKLATNQSLNAGAASFNSSRSEKGTGEFINKTSQSFVPLQIIAKTSSILAPSKGIGQMKQHDQVLKQYHWLYHKNDPVTLTKVSEGDSPSTIDAEIVPGETPATKLKNVEVPKPMEIISIPVQTSFEWISPPYRKQRAELSTSELGWQLSKHLLPSPGGRNLDEQHYASLNEDESLARTATDTYPSPFQGLQKQSVLIDGEMASPTPRGGKTSRNWDHQADQEDVGLVVSSVNYRPKLENQPLHQQQPKPNYLTSPIDPEGAPSSKQSAVEDLNHPEVQFFDDSEWKPIQANSGTQFAYLT